MGDLTKKRQARPDQARLRKLEKEMEKCIILHIV